MREINKMESEELKALADELTPYTKNYLVNMVTVLDDSDAKRMGKWSDLSLSEKYIKNLDHLKEAEPKNRDKNQAYAKAFESAKIDLILGGDKVDEAMHSNNWVIHGKHTSTGKPMLANDPHLGTNLPSFWTLSELIWGDKFLIGASAPGIPLIGIGRSKNISWGQTSPLCDNSDLWQENLDETLTKYFVDGEWRDLKIINEVIKVQGSSDIIYPVRFTHRGPIM
jgi:acyl-homoserine lactone acylase PvdQ